MADNAIYTPTPRYIDVVVYQDCQGDVRAASGQRHLVSLNGDVLSEEAARVVARGNLLRNGRERWYTVELADGSRHSVIGEGS
jgi:hypothetical protein